jgi:hypothetical protein
MALMKEGVPADSPVVMELMKDASISPMTITEPGYDPLFGRSEAEILEWHLYMMFLSFDRAAGRSGGEPDGVASHVEWLLQRPFQNVAEWLGEEGDKWRAVQRMPAMPESCKTDCAVFLDQHRGWTLPDVVNKLRSLQSEFEAEKAKRSGAAKAKRKKQPTASP